MQPGAMLYTQGFGSRPENLEVPHYEPRAPTTTDTNYPVGKRWIYINVSEWVLLGLTSFNGITTANWIQVAASGALTLGGPLTVTSGAITATNGNLVLGTAGNKIVIATGANASVGTSAAMTTGAVTVATTASSTTALIYYSRKTTGGTSGQVSITAQDATGFTLTSTSATETSTFNWWIINA